MSNDTVRTRYTDVAEFEEQLEQAETNANNDFEMEFTSDMRVKYNKWGADMFISEKQADCLERIANRD